MKLLFLSEIQWLSQPSRKHQFIRRLPADWEILFVSPINYTRDENRLRLGRARAQANVRHVSIPLPKPDSPLPGARVMSGVLWWLGRNRIESLARGFRPDAVVCSNIWAASLVPWFRARGVPVVYDCNDYHPRFFPRWRAPAEQAFASLVAEADEVVASSSYLREMCGRGVVIGNGADLDTFVPDVPSEAPAPLADSRLAGCEDLVVYLGSVDDRLDFDCLESVARTLSRRARRTGLVMVGRVFGSARREAERLAARHPDTVLLAGRRPYDELPAWLSRARVGLAPFVQTEKTAAINANKLYIYAAMGLDIVATPFSEDVRRHEDPIYLASSPEAFAAAVLEALADEKRRQTVRAAIAQPNGWDDKVSHYIRLLGDITSRRGA